MSTKDFPTAFRVRVSPHAVLDAGREGVVHAPGPVRGTFWVRFDGQRSSQDEIGLVAAHNLQSVEAAA